MKYCRPHAETACGRYLLFNQIELNKFFMFLSALPSPEQILAIPFTVPFPLSMSRSPCAIVSENTPMLMEIKFLIGIWRAIAFIIPRFASSEERKVLTALSITLFTNLPCFVKFASSRVEVRSSSAALSLLFAGMGLPRTVSNCESGTFLTSAV